MQKTGWTIHSSLLVWKRVSLWMWSLGGSSNHFPVYWAIFGMVTNKRQPGDPSASLLLTSVRRQSFAKCRGKWPQKGSWPLESVESTSNNSNLKLNLALFFWFWNEEIYWDYFKSCSPVQSGFAKKHRLTHFCCILHQQKKKERCQSCI